MLLSTSHNNTFIERNRYIEGQLGMTGPVGAATSNGVPIDRGDLLLNPSENGPITGSMLDMMLAK